MARIRTIKPEFFTDPDVAKLDPRARLLYIAMWCAADDFGVGETNINSLLGLAFPDSDEVSAPLLRRFCADIAQHLRVTFYEVRGRHYYAIPTWEKHQKLERRSDRRKHPAPDDSDATPDLRILPPPESAPELRRENGAESCEILPEQGKGNRGKGTGEISVETSQVCHQGADRVAPAQKCPRHIEDPNPPDCGGCASASREHKRWLADQRKREQAEANQKQSLAQLIRDCPECDDYGRDDDLNPCPLHPTLKETA